MSARIRRWTLAGLLRTRRHHARRADAGGGANRPAAGTARPARPAPHAGSWEVSGGLLWQGGFDLGNRDAELTRNPATGTGPYDLFASASSLGSGLGVQARVAGYLSRSMAIEGGLRITRPTLNIDLSGDVESAPDLTATETLTQYVFDGSLMWHFAPFHKGRAVPYVAGGAGYMRDLHEGNALIETGVEYHGMAGLKWWFSSRPKRLGYSRRGRVLGARRRVRLWRRPTDGARRVGLADLSLLARVPRQQGAEKGHVNSQPPTPNIPRDPICCEIWTLGVGNWVLRVDSPSCSASC